MRQKISLVAVLPDGREFFAEIDPVGNHIGNDYHYKKVAEDAVLKAGLKTSREEPEAVKVKVFVLHIQEGQLVRLPHRDYHVTPPMPRMGDDEYETELQALLSEIPPDFHSYVRSQAWDHGHSAGYEEVLSYARDMLYGLKPAITVFQARITAPKE